MVVADLRDMSDSDKLDLVRGKLNNTAVESLHDAIILLDELDKIVEA